jgi:nucleotide-binding universal stress UspA family protein
MIPKYRKIVYATDLSRSARTAFRHAIAVADTYKAKIHLVHVFSNSMVKMYSFPGLELPPDDEVIAQIRVSLNAFVQEEMPYGRNAVEILAGIDVVEGSVSSEVIKLANKLNADLIVIGNHGKGVLKYAFLGSVAEKILLESDCPVLVIPLAD